MTSPANQRHNTHNHNPLPFECSQLVYLNSSCQTAPLRCTHHSVHMSIAITIPSTFYCIFYSLSSSLYNSHRHQHSHQPLEQVSHLLCLLKLLGLFISSHFYSLCWDTIAMHKFAKDDCQLSVRQSFFGQHR